MKAGIRQRESSRNTTNKSVVFQGQSSRVVTDRKGASTLSDTGSSAIPGQLLWYHRVGRRWTASVHMVGWGTGVLGWKPMRRHLNQAKVCHLWTSSFKVSAETWPWRSQGRNDRSRKKRKMEERARERVSETDGLDGVWVVPVFKALGEV